MGHVAELDECNWTDLASNPFFIVQRGLCSSLTDEPVKSHEKAVCCRAHLESMATYYAEQLAGKCG
jgi:hypothetical protein